MSKNRTVERKITKTSKIHAVRSNTRKAKPRSGRGPGKPTISEDELIEQRDRWAYALENHWGEVGWKLRCARTPEHIRAALEPLAKQGSSPYPLNLFLRPATKTVSAGAKQDTKKALGATVPRMYEANDVQRKAAENFQKVESVALEFSDQNRQHLQSEIERRKENITSLKIKMSNTKAEIRRKELLQKETEQRNCASLEDELKSLRSELEGIEIETSTENNHIGKVEERLRAATPEKRKLVNTAYAQRKAELDAANQQVSELNAEYNKLEGILSDQQADFCQRELLKFIRGKRYSHTPRKLANAIAGLPVISCRQSATRCAKIPYTWKPDYSFFEFAEETWRGRIPSQSKPEQILDLFRNAIAALPRTLLGQPAEDGTRKRFDNYFRSDLCGKWLYLKQAIQDALRAYTHPDQVPYLITARFKENVAKPRTAVDELLAAQEKLEL